VNTCFDSKADLSSRNVRNAGKRTSGWRRVKAQRACAVFLALLILGLITPAKARATSGPLWILFEHDSGELDTKALHLLVRAAQVRSGAILLISGHADVSGPTQYNLALSGRRADAVREALIRLGVPRSHLRTEAFGEARPLEGRPGKAIGPFNRRVELDLMPADSLEPP
jgi:outer membrane protein OmpA-like peptidoglycan-associated protein